MRSISYKKKTTGSGGRDVRAQISEVGLRKHTTGRVMWQNPEIAKKQEKKDERGRKKEPLRHKCCSIAALALRKNDAQQKTTPPYQQSGPIETMNFQREDSSRKKSENCHPGPNCDPVLSHFLES